MSHPYTLSAIYIYPIKSLGGILVSRAAVEKRGLQYDRRWMLVDENHQFLTQRKFPQMALLKTEWQDKYVRVVASDKPDLLVPLQPVAGDTLRVTVWEDTCEALAVSPEADRWFSEAIGFACRLVYMPENSIRPVDHRYARTDDEVSFADGYPFLAIGEASLNDLNSKLSEKIPMNRFRPNFVISGSPAFAEDNWSEIRIGESVFFGVKPCARCVMTTINQQTAQKGAEPLRTLATYRSANNKIYFGQNLLYGHKGREVKVGDPVEVISSRANSLF